MASTSERTIFRPFSSFEWLHDRLNTRYPYLLIPPLPEYQPSQTSQQDYADRKCAQLERYFNKILARHELESDSDLTYFLKDDAVLSGGASTAGALGTALSASSSRSTSPEKKGYWSIPLLSHVLRPDYNQGFREYVVSDFVEDPEDRVVFERRKVYLSNMDFCFADLVRSMQDLLRLQDGMAKSVQQFGYVIKEQLGDSLLKDGRSEDEHWQNPLWKPMDELYKLTKELKQVNQRRVIDETNQVSDVFEEYAQTITSAKSVMNHRTDLLLEYNEALKTKLKKLERTEKAKLKVPINPEEVQECEADEVKAKEESDAKKDAFDKNNSELTKELSRFERDKGRDLKQAMDKYAAIQIRYAQEMHRLCEAALVHFQE